MAAETALIHLKIVSLYEKPHRLTVNTDVTNGANMAGNPGPKEGWNKSNVNATVELELRRNSGVVTPEFQCEHGLTYNAQSACRRWHLVGMVGHGRRWLHNIGPTLGH